MDSDSSLSFLSTWPMTLSEQITVMPRSPSGCEVVGWISTCSIDSFKMSTRAEFSVYRNHMNTITHACRLHLSTQSHHRFRGLILRLYVQVILFDFSPVGGTTNPLLFSWEELDHEIVKDQKNEATDQSPKSDDKLAQVSNCSACDIWIIKIYYTWEWVWQILQWWNRQEKLKKFWNSEINDAKYASHDIATDANIEVSSADKCGVETHPWLWSPVFVKLDSDLRDLPEVQFRVVTEANRIQSNMPQYVWYDSGRNVWGPAGQVAEQYNWAE